MAASSRSRRPWTAPAASRAARRPRAAVVGARRRTRRARPRRHAIGKRRRVATIPSRRRTRSAATGSPRCASACPTRRPTRTRSRRRGGARRRRPRRDRARARAGVGGVGPAARPHAGGRSARRAPGGGLVPRPRAARLPRAELLGYLRAAERHVEPPTVAAARTRPSTSSSPGFAPRSTASTCSPSPPPGPAAAARRRPGPRPRELTVLCRPGERRRAAAASVPCGTHRDGLPIGAAARGRRRARGASPPSSASPPRGRRRRHEAGRLRVPPGRHGRGRARAARRAGDDAKLLAGGQSLVPMMNFRLVRPGRARRHQRASPTCDYIARDGRRCGSARSPCTARSSTRTTTLLEGFGVLKAAAPLVGHYPIRTRGTFGGSVAHGDPSSEWCMLAAAARRRDRRPRSPRASA